MDESVADRPRRDAFRQASVLIFRCEGSAVSTRRAKLSRDDNLPPEFFLRIEEEEVAQVERSAQRKSVEILALDVASLSINERRQRCGRVRSGKMSL